MSEILNAVVIGAGAAGAAASIKLKESGFENILLVDRGSRTGGILNQCIHPGFGLSYFKEELTGPQYATKLDEMLDRSGVAKLYDSTVLDITVNRGDIGNTYKLSIASGNFPLKEISTKVVIMATGSFERTRENIGVAGTRPAGVFTAGAAQRFINIEGHRIGHNVVIQGSGDIGLIMARRLSIEGYNVVRVLERLPYLSGLLRNKIQCLDDFHIPLALGKEITEISGDRRVTGVYVDDAAGSGKESEFIPCDTVLFAVGLIPEAELLKETDIPGLLDRGGIPLVNNRFEMPLKGIFTAGNALHINDLADSASVEGEKAACAAMEYLKDNDSFNKTVEERLPYNEIIRPQFTSSYFNSIEGKIICVICPKGCVVSDGEFGCKRGKIFLDKEKQDKPRIFTTTVAIKNKKGYTRYAVRSIKPIPLAAQGKIKTEMVRNEPFQSKKTFYEVFKNELVLTVISVDFTSPLT